LRLINGGIVLINPKSSAVRRVIALQYNPDTVTRTLQTQTVGGGADPSEAMRLKGPPIDRIILEAALDAADGMEFPDRNPNTAEFGIPPQLAALETILYPASTQLQSNNPGNRIWQILFDPQYLAVSRPEALFPAIKKWLPTVQ
jgi:hypothetical protein